MYQGYSEQGVNVLRCYSKVVKEKQFKICVLIEFRLIFCWIYYLFTCDLYVKIKYYIRLQPLSHRYTYKITI